MESVALRALEMICHVSSSGRNESECGFLVQVRSAASGIGLLAQGWARVVRVTLRSAFFADTVVWLVVLGLLDCGRYLDCMHALHKQRSRPLDVVPIAALCAPF
jgi:hypothetical protein